MTRPVEELEGLIAGLRILLADDSEDNRYLIFSYLRRAQVNIDVAENGQIALNKFREREYDVVLMDVEMPVMDGYQATLGIRRHEAESKAQPTPVLALTAHAFAEMAVRGKEAGFTALLTKPIRKATLLEALLQYAPNNRVPVKSRPDVNPAPPESTSDPASIPVATERLVIEVEEGMEDVTPAYLEKRTADIATYESAVGRGDFETVRGLAHKMKGTGTGYGFPVLTEIGSELEQAAKAQDAGRVREALERMKVYVGSIELKYSK